MKKNPYFLNVILAVVSFVALASMCLTRVFLPGAVLPPINVPNLALVTLVALVLTHLFFPEATPTTLGETICSTALAAVLFTLFPLMAGFSCVHTCWTVGAVGGVVFLLCYLVLASAAQRITTNGGKGAGALIITAFGVFLAVQSLQGMLL